MGAVVRFGRVRPQGEIACWRQRGYEAVDCRVKRLQGEIGEKDFEAMSDLLGREGRRLTGAIFEEVIKSRGAKESSRDTRVCEECGATLRRQKQLHTKAVENRHGEITMKFSAP
jgi:hypothetical protein